MYRSQVKKVGITGGIGCGKSTVLAEFQRTGISCFEADKVAAGYYNESAFLADIRLLFGSKAILPDGGADKRYIASVVFSDNAMLAKLNALVHPKVLHDFEDFCTVHRGEPYVLFESAILYECGLDSMMDAVVCVYLDEAERIERLMLRDKATEEQIRARMANQLPAYVPMLKADYVVLNYEGNPRQRQVAFIDNKLRQ